MKDSSIKLSVGILALLGGLTSVAATPAAAESTPSPSNSAISSSVQGGDLPFFARFLEGQQEEIAGDKEDRKDSKFHKKHKPDRGHDRVTTRKYPSDQEDNTGGGTVTTRKYPSDQEDNTGGGTVTTQKFPSDNEDNTGGGIFVTKKFPSDAEDNHQGHPR